MHLFILAANNMHTFPFLRYLIDECKIQKDKIRVLFFDIESEIYLSDSIKGIEYYYLKDWKNLELYTDVVNVTISSLSSINNQAEYIYNILNSGLIKYNQLIIRITDDETDRWNRIYNGNNGNLVISKEAHVDKFTLAILEQVSKFICLYKPWGKKLEKLLNRKLVIYDVSVLVNPFTTSDTYSFYTNILRPSVRKQIKNSKVVRILIHTKSTPSNIVLNILLKDLFNFILHNNDLLDSRVLEVSLWWPNSIRNMPAFNLAIGLLILLSKSRKIKLRFNFVNSMPTEVYYSFLSSIHILIAQNRGGLGAIIEASKCGSIIVINKDSYNAEVYSRYRSIPFIESSKSKNIFTSSIKFLKENNFETLLDEQKSIATKFFEEESLKSKGIFFKIYS